MLNRSFAGVLAVLALVCFVSQATFAQGDKDKQKTHSGVVVKVADGKLTMSDKDGKNQHVHKVAPTAKITCDGKDCKLTDLKEGYSVTVTFADDADKTASRIDAKKA
jgi:hypothetical protein